MKLFNYKFEPKNREQRRKVEKEIQKALPVFVQLEQDFLQELFDDSSNSYNDTYSKHLEHWNKTIDEWIKLNRLNFIFINRFYLEEQYKPIES